MVVGLGGLTLCAIMYQGVKEAWRFSYIFPSMPKGVRGNAGWEELRYRHPNPASVKTNEFHARAIERHHYKTPYLQSRHAIRNYWDPNLQEYLYQHGTYAPDLATLSEAQQAKLLNYIEEDIEGNKQKKEQYEEFYARTRKQSQTGVMSEELAAWKANPALLRQRIREDNAWMKTLDAWEDEEDFKEPTNLPALPLNKQYRMEYWLTFWTSYEMQLTLEFDCIAEGIRDYYVEKGIDSYKGDRYLWQAGGGNLPADQIAQLNALLKLRNPVAPQP